MLTLISRAVGIVVVLGLSAVGAHTVVTRILTWKERHDQLGRSGGSIQAL